MFAGYGLVALMLAIGATLLIGELVLPTHGVLGVLGAGTALAAVGLAGLQNPWAGVLLAVALGLATPFVWTAVVKIWPRTPVGRRLVLPPIEQPLPQPPVRVGQVGIAVSALRPMGLCEFDDGTRVEATSEHEMIAPGTAVRVVALVNNRPTVRVVV